LALFGKGVAIGFAIAAPVGPVGVLCIRRTLHFGRWVGLFSGLGAASADATYGAIAGFGVSSVSAFLLEFEDWLRVFGGLFLLGLGAHILMRAPAGQAAAPAPVQSRLAGAFTSCFLLTLTNPATIMSFVAIFAGLGLVEMGRDYGAAVALVAGVFVGSAVWWLALSASVGLLHGRMNTATLPWINRISGTVILAFGAFALATAAL
jgi:threonine/homoserine/homoserine lactone efflux protein